MTAFASDSTVGQLVAERPSRSRLFQKLGIDFCCGGKKPLELVCREKGLDFRTVATLLEAEDADDRGTDIDASAMPLTALCDHIEETHHGYLRAELPRLNAMVHKVAHVHGEHHPWMREVLEVLVVFTEELSSHMLKEEQVLFPIIRAIDAGRPGAAAHCGGTLANPIRAMEHEHDSAGDALARIRVLTSGFTPPEGACNTFRASLDGLRELEADMHQHVHKENNVLFPRALQLEASQKEAR